MLDAKMSPEGTGILSMSIEIIVPSIWTNPNLPMSPDYFITFRAMLEMFRLRISQRKRFVVSHTNSQHEVVRQFFADESDARVKEAHYYNKGFKTTVNYIDEELVELAMLYNANVAEECKELFPVWADHSLVENFSNGKTIDTADAIVRLTAPWLNCNTAYYPYAMNPDGLWVEMLIETPDGCESHVLKIGELTNFRLPHDPYRGLIRDVTFRPMNAAELFYNLVAKNRKSKCSNL